MVGQDARRVVNINMTVEKLHQVEATSDAKWERRDATLWDKNRQRSGTKLNITRLNEEIFSSDDSPANVPTRVPVDVNTAATLLTLQCFRSVSSFSQLITCILEGWHMCSTNSSL